MELYATNLHFLGDTPQEQCLDYCIHGGVVFKIGNTQLSNDDDDWCVSASAYRFLKTLFEDHIASECEQMIPCCGHFMVPSEDNTSVSIIGCTNGIDFDVVRAGDNVVFHTQDGQVFEVPLQAYKPAVLSFAQQIQDFYQNHPPRHFTEAHEQEAFEVFCKEWKTLIEQAQDVMPVTPEIIFDDYDCYTENDILCISAEGIFLKNMQFISFRACAQNYARIHGGSGRCVGERDISGSNFSFAFYTAPKTTHIFYIPEKKWKRIFIKITAEQRFQNLQKQIESFGFTTYDMT